MSPAAFDLVTEKMTTLASRPCTASTVLTSTASDSSSGATPASRCRKCAPPAARYHDTRHTYASTLLSGGVSVAAAAEYLGHSPAVPSAVTSSFSSAT